MFLFVVIFIVILREMVFHKACWPVLHVDWDTNEFMTIDSYTEFFLFSISWLFCVHILT